MSTPKDGMDTDSQPQEPKERLMPSHATSKPSATFGSIEIDYLTRIEAAMQNPVQSSTVKMWLAEAEGKGLDPQRIYEAAVSARPPHWTEAPPFSDVAPRL
jgi:hypothetical protein